MGKSALIIFVKNPVLGKVKTRLAKDIGDEAALRVYKSLLERTREVVSGLDVTKLLYYSDEVNELDEWSNESYKKEVQLQDDNLGARMEAAMHDTFLEGNDKVVIIGSDCPAISEQHLNEAFSILGDHDVVIGPATDGGYYLLGMKKVHKELFQHNKWSSTHVLEYTQDVAGQLGLSYKLLEELSDIDEMKDLQHYKDINEQVNFLNK